MVSSNQAVTDARNLFSLHRLAFVLSRYAPPEGGFNPFGQWNLKYTYHSLGYWYFRRQGSLHIERKRQDDGVLFSFNCMRLGRTGYNHYISAKVLARDDPLSTPLSWTMEAKLATGPDATPYLLSGIRKTAQFRDGALTVTCNGDSEVTHIPGDYTCKWSLIDVVQRLLNASTERRSFSLVDEFDEVRHHQTIAYRTSANVPLKGMPRNLTAYEHLGEGVIPTVYWVDEFGRALFVVSGVEAFVLSEANGVVADFDDSPLHGQAIPKLLAERA